MLRIEFQDTTTKKPVILPLFYMTWYDFDTDKNKNAVESMCIEQNQVDSSQSAFTENKYLSYYEVKASDPESVKKYFKAAWPLRPTLSDDNLSKLGKRLDNTACFVGSCRARAGCQSVWWRYMIHNER